MSLTHIETIELTSSQSSIEFTSIPQDYDDLVILTSTRNDESRVDGRIFITLNNNTASNYPVVTLTGDGTSADTGSATAQNFVSRAAGATSTTNTFDNSEIYISNYTAATDKSISVESTVENNATTNTMQLRAVLWTNNQSVSSIQMDAGGNFVAGSLASLYGVTAGGDGTVTTA